MFEIIFERTQQQQKKTECQTYIKMCILRYVSSLTLFIFLKSFLTSFFVVLTK